MSSNGNFSEGQSEDKATYESPTLRVYGSVSDLTQAVGLSGGTDGGAIPLTKKKLTPSL